ncbi:MAG: retroviral-like aspartic protease family protein [Saprospiraceae bacterium]|nr:retroviral-like aspartic protease family protein [Saprospiraceae bacterium]
MKIIIQTIILIIYVINTSTAQTVIKMEKIGGVYVLPCEVNGLSLRFIFDTGASDVSISLTEALFMLKNGYLSDNDLKGTEYYRIANGDVAEGTEIILREIKIGNLKMHNIKASVVHELSAPLLLGQSALSKLGKIEFDYSTNTLTIKNGPNYYINTEPSSGNQEYINSSSYKHPDSNYSGYYKFKTTLDNPPFEIPLRDKSGIDGIELYKCPKNATIYVIDNSGQEYFKVYVNGYTGYLRNHWLKKW